MAFSDFTNSQKATVMRFTDNKWEPVGMKGFSDGQAAWISLAFSGPTPYVAFSDKTNSFKTTVTLTMNSMLRKEPGPLPR